MPVTLQDIISAARESSGFKNLSKEDKWEAIDQVLKQTGLHKPTEVGSRKDVEAGLMAAGIDLEPKENPWLVKAAQKSPYAARILEQTRASEEFAKEHPFVERAALTAMESGQPWLGYMATPEERAGLAAYKEERGKELGFAGRLGADVAGFTYGALPYFMLGEAALAPAFRGPAGAIARKVLPAAKAPAFGTGRRIAQQKILSESVKQGLTGAVLGAAYEGAQVVPGYDDQFGLDATIARLEQAGWGSALFGGLGMASPYAGAFLSRLKARKAAGKRIFSKVEAEADMNSIMLEQEAGGFKGQVTPEGVAGQVPEVLPQHAGKTPRPAVPGAVPLTAEEELVTGAAAVPGVKPLPRPEVLPAPGIEAAAVPGVERMVPPSVGFPPATGRTTTAAPKLGSQAKPKTRPTKKVHIPGQLEGEIALAQHYENVGAYYGQRTSKTVKTIAKVEARGTEADIPKPRRRKGVAPKGKEAKPRVEPEEIPEVPYLESEKHLKARAKRIEVKEELEDIEKTGREALEEAKAKLKEEPGAKAKARAKVTKEAEAEARARSAELTEREAETARLNKIRERSADINQRILENYTDISDKMYAAWRSVQAGKHTIEDLEKAGIATIKGTFGITDDATAKLMFDDMMKVAERRAGAGPVQELTVEGGQRTIDATSKAADSAPPEAYFDMMELVEDAFAGGKRLSETAERDLRRRLFAMANTALKEQGIADAKAAKTSALMVERAVEDGVDMATGGVIDNETRMVVNRLKRGGEYGGISLSTSVDVMGENLYKDLIREVTGEDIGKLVQGVTKGRVVAGEASKDIKTALGRLKKSERVLVQEFLKSVRAIKGLEGRLTWNEYKAAREYSLAQGSLFTATKRDHATLRKLLNYSLHKEDMITETVVDTFIAGRPAGARKSILATFRPWRKSLDDIGLAAPAYSAHRMNHAVAADLRKELYNVLGLNAFSKDFKAQVAGMLKGEVPMSGAAGQAAQDLKLFSDYLYYLFGIDGKAAFVEHYMPRIIDFAKLGQMLKAGQKLPADAEQILAKKGIIIDYADPEGTLGHIRRRVRRPERRLMDEVGFFAENERQVKALEQMFPLVEDPVRAFETYIHYGTRKMFMEPLLDLFRWQTRVLKGFEVVKEAPKGKQVVVPERFVGKGGEPTEIAGTFKGRELARHAEEYINNVMGRKGYLAVEYENLFDNLASNFGLDIPVGGGQAVAQFMADLAYLTYLGAPRVGAPIKNLTQQSLAMATEGIQWWGVGAYRAGTAEGRALFKAGVPGPSVAAEFLGMPAKGLSKWKTFVQASLTMFRASDRFNRMVSFHAGHARAKWAAEGLRNPSEFAKLLKAQGAADLNSAEISKFYNSRANRAPLDRQRQVLRILGQTNERSKMVRLLNALEENDIAKFAMIRGDFVQGQTQWLYGTAGSAPIYQNPIGKIFGVFTTWPMNYAELLGAVGKQAAHGNIRPLLTMIGTTYGAMKLGEMIGVEVKRWVGLGPFGGVTPDSWVWAQRIMPLLRLITSGNAIQGDPFAVERINEFTSDMYDAWNVPWGLTGIKDIADAYDEFNRGNKVRGAMEFLGIPMEPESLRRAPRPGGRIRRQGPFQEKQIDVNPYEELQRRLYQ